METVYVISRYLINQSTGERVVKPVAVFREYKDADLWVLRRTQVKDVDWYVVEKCPGELQTQSFWKALFG